MCEEPEGVDSLVRKEIEQEATRIRGSGNRKIRSQYMEAVELEGSGDQELQRQEMEQEARLIRSRPSVAYKRHSPRRWSQVGHLPFYLSISSSLPSPSHSEMGWTGELWSMTNFLK